MHTRLSLFKSYNGDNLFSLSGRKRFLNSQTRIRYPSHNSTLPIFSWKVMRFVILFVER
jgi:hypothetical protein